MRGCFGGFWRRRARLTGWRSGFRATVCRCAGRLWCTGWRVRILWCRSIFEGGGRMGFFKMGCSIKERRKVWKIRGFTGTFSYGMINMLGGFHGGSCPSCVATRMSSIRTCSTGVSTIRLSMVGRAAPLAHGQTLRLIFGGSFAKMKENAKRSCFA